MGIGLEPRQARTLEGQPQQVRAPVVLRSGELKLSIDPDGSIRFLESLSEGRLLFGREQLHIYRPQGGSQSQLSRLEWRVTSNGREATFTARAPDSLEISLSTRLLRMGSPGYSRTVSLRNPGPRQGRVRLISLSDPTTAHFRDRSYEWGSIGVNAFNRTSHVAADEVVEPSSPRVMGARPPPRTIYMTSDRAKALELVERGELPDQTAGMSGQVLVLFEHEMELQPGGTAEVTYASVYNPSKLEAALSDFESSLKAGSAPPTDGSWFACSSPHITSAFAWAMVALEGVQFERDSLDRLECLRGLTLLGSPASKEIIERTRVTIGSAGSVHHSLAPGRAGLLETSVFLEGCSRFALLSGDKKYTRTIYPALRRAANFLAEYSGEGSARIDSDLPQGWRRRIGKGYPSGEVSEVSLSVAGALSRASMVSSRLVKSPDSSKYKEKSLLLVTSIKKRLVDERGFLALCMDGAGRLRMDETIDQVVACYRFPFERSISASVVHRTLERDFDTGLGPRTLPSSNRLVFNNTYGDGQIGGYWTRAALAHTVLAYSAVLGGTGSLELEAIARMVSSDYAKFGSAPGDFPYWLDMARKEARSQGSDPVAAARFVEATVAGELGVTCGQDGPALDPSVSSSLKWASGGDLLPGKKLTAFVGRYSGHAFVFLCGAKPAGADDFVYSSAERARTDDPLITAVSLYGKGQAVCVGNSSDAAVKTVVQFRPREPSLAKRLTASLDELDTQSRQWRKKSSIRVLPTMSFEVSLGPGEWKAYRVST